MKTIVKPLSERCKGREWNGRVRVLKSTEDYNARMHVDKNNHGPSYACVCVCVCVDRGVCWCVWWCVRGCVARVVCWCVYLWWCVCVCVDRGVC